MLLGNFACFFFGGGGGGGGEVGRGAADFFFFALSLSRMDPLVSKLALLEKYFTTGGTRVPDPPEKSQKCKVSQQYMITGPNPLKNHN